MTARSNELVRFLVIALGSILATTIANAQSTKSSTMINKTNWTDAEISREFELYKFYDLDFLESGDLAEPKLVILSGFFAVGKYWSDLDKPRKEQTVAAFARRDQLAAAFRSVASVRISAVADRIRLIKTERTMAWLCIVGRGCYPKGLVVGLGPVDAETAGAICDRQRRNRDFCHIYEHLKEEMLPWCADNKHLFGCPRLPKTD